MPGDPALSALPSVLAYIGSSGLAIGTFSWRVSRAVQLHRAVSAATDKDSGDERRKAGLEIVQGLTRREREPWYRALLPGRKPDDGEP
jgi:hypothetical protein